MTAFAGVVRFDGNVHHAQTEERIGRAIAASRSRIVATANRPGRMHVRRAPGALFLQSGESPTDSAGDADIVSPSSERRLFAARSRLDNRVELAAALAIPSSELAGISDASLILRTYEQWGEAGIGRCVGAFAFSLWDVNARRLILGRDCLGNQSLFFHRGRGFVAFATALNILLSIPDVPRDLDEETLADFLAVNVLELRRTLYRGIERVPSRMLVAIDQDGVSHRHYWSPDIDGAPPYSRAEDYIERARELFDQAVASSTADTRHVAISASGGLDSSSIAATVARLGRAARITCYTVVPPLGTQIDLGASRYADERDKMEALARRYPSLEIRYVDREDLHPNEIDPVRLFLGLGLPSTGTAVLGPYSYLYDEVAAAGHRVLVVGNRGNFGLSWRGRYSLLALLRSGRWATFAHELSASAGQGQGILQALKAEVVLLALPRGARRGIHRVRGRDPDSVGRFSALSPSYIAERELPEKWRKQGFDPWFARAGSSPKQVRAAILFDENQMARDMRGMNSEWYGFDYSDPHSDRRLLEFVLKVPEPMFRRNGVPRSFARDVFADRLPPEILSERRRGAQTVTWFSHLNARRQSIASEIERMEGSNLARRLIDLPRLKQLMREWPEDEHAAQARADEYRLMLMRAVHAGRFIRWVEGANG